MYFHLMIFQGLPNPICFWISEIFWVPEFFPEFISFGDEDGVLDF